MNAECPNCKEPMRIAGAYTRGSVEGKATVNPYLCHKCKQLVYPQKVNDVRSSGDCRAKGTE